MLRIFPAQKLLLCLFAFATVFCVVTFAANFSTAAQLQWPQWRGPNRTDISDETGLLKSWPEGGPQQKWLYKNAGLGYSGPAIVDDRMYLMGTRGEQEILLALDIDTGEEIWHTEMGSILENNWGNGPRGTPTIDGDLIYSMSATGILTCTRVSNGTMVWQTSMSDLGGSLPSWGFTESVLVDNEFVICTPGGDAGTIVALDKQTGKPHWQSKEWTDGAQYSSIMVTELNGVRQYIQLTQQRVASVAADDGRLLWEADWPGQTAVVATPIVRNDSIYVTSGYGVGCMLIRIGPNNEVSEIYRNKVVKNHHGGVILVGDHVYGYSDGVGWVCQDFETGELVWKDKDKLGKGGVGYADGMLYCISEQDGTVVLVDASPAGWKEYGRFTLTPQTELRKPAGKIWVHPVVVNGNLYLRDQDLVYCYDVKE